MVCSPDERLRHPGRPLPGLQEQSGLPGTDGMRDITPLVAPRSIAVIGASANPSKSGGVLFDNLVKGKFHGPLYPINRTAAEIMGRKAYPTLAEVAGEGRPRLHRSSRSSTSKPPCSNASRPARVPPASSPPGSPRRATKAAPTRSGCARSRARAGLLLAGPNTIGMVNAEVGMMGSFVNFPRWERGGVSFFTQTGIFTGAVMLHVMSAEVQRLPVGKSIDVGNKIDVDELDFLHYVAGDPGTAGDRVLYRKHPASALRSSTRRAKCAEQSRSSCSSRAAAARAPRPPPFTPARTQRIMCKSRTRCADTASRARRTRTNFSTRCAPSSCCRDRAAGASAWPRRAARSA